MSYESVKRINSLKSGIEKVTGESYSDLTKAVQGLKNGYGIGEEKPYIDTSKITDFSYFCMDNRMNDLVHLIDFSKGKKFYRTFAECNRFTAFPEIDTSKGTNFEYMFSGCDGTDKFPKLNTSNGKNFKGMFSGSSVSKSVIAQLDLSNGTSFDYMFVLCSGLDDIPKLDISNGTSFDSMFADCIYLRSIELVTPKGNLSVNTFLNCFSLENVIIAEGWNVNIYLHYSDQLTVECLHGMIENLADITGQTPKTFEAGETNLAKIDAEHITMLDAKGWIYS